MSKPRKRVDPDLSRKRAEAGRKGAESRWGRKDYPDVMSRLKTARPLADLQSGRNDWYEIKNVGRNQAEVYIYDEIGYFGVTASDFIADLKAIKAGKITLHLNTPGGDVFDGVAIFNALRDHKAEITGIVDSVALSAGSFILQAADQRVMNRASELMIHNASGLAIGDSATMRELADLLDRQNRKIADIYARRSGVDADEWLTAMENESWFDAEEAVEAGLADETVENDDADTENSFDLSIYRYGGRDDAPDPDIDASTDKPGQGGRPDDAGYDDTDEGVPEWLR